MAAAEKCRLVFMGTSDFAVTILHALNSWSRGEVVAVFTQPDRPSGRGHALQPTPVKRAALALGLSIFQPLNFKAPEALLQLSEQKPDFILVAAYGLILPDALLRMPAMDILNVHASLLPRYRGAAPIQRAIMENPGEGAITGVSIMRVTSRLDAGPVCASKEVGIGVHTAASLQGILAEEGATLLLQSLEDILAGRAVWREQDENKATYAAKLLKKDGHIDWNQSAHVVDAHIRAVTPWPGARAKFFLCGASEPVTVLLPPGKIGMPRHNISPGKILFDGKMLSISCKDFWYQIATLRPQGRRDISALGFFHGYVRNCKDGFCGEIMSF